jgi:hypothetical protein
MYGSWNGNLEPKVGACGQSRAKLAKNAKRSQAEETYRHGVIYNPL